MTHAAWISSRRPAAPERLVARVRAEFDANPSWAALSTTEALLLAGESLLRAVLAEGQGLARASALDLLAADACVTWAFEAAADSPERLSMQASDAVRRIAEVAA